MIAAISKKISISLLKNNAINPEELNVYAYGIQLLIMNIVDWCITFFFILLIGKIYLSIIYLSVFFLLRRHCGGYHTETHIRCIIVSNAVFIGSILISANIYCKHFAVLVFVGEIINYIIIYKYSPSEHPNKTITPYELAIHKKIGRFFNLIISIIAIIGVLNGLDHFACAIIMGQLSVSIAVILQNFKNKLRKDMK